MIIYLCTGAHPLGAEEIIVRREVIKGPGIHLPLEQSVSPKSSDFYQELSEHLFLQTSPFSFFSGTSDLRFMGQGSSQIAILVDGIPQNSSTGIAGSRNYQFIRPDSFERVQISAGTGTSIYGGNAFSGVVNFVRRKVPGQKINLTAGSNGLQDIYMSSQSKKTDRSFGQSFQDNTTKPSLESKVNASQSKRLENDKRGIE